MYELLMLTISAIQLNTLNLKIKNYECIAGVSPSDDCCENFSRGQHRQAMLKRIRNDNKRYHTAGVVDDIKV